jgi:hypothetical protein
LDRFQDKSSELNVLVMMLWVLACLLDLRCGAELAADES